VSSTAIFWIALAFIFGGTLLGIALRGRFLDSHLNADAKDVLRLGTGLIATMAALVVGLLISSAKSSYDAQNTQIQRLSAGVVLLDQLLAQYGPEAEPARVLLRRGVVTVVDRIWLKSGAEPARGVPFEASAEGTRFYEKIDELSPKNDAQRSLKARVIQTSTDLALARLLLFSQLGNSIPVPFLAIVVCWLTIIFASFSLFAQPNAVVVAALFIFGLSASSALFLIVDLSQPFAGLMQISSSQLRNALAPLGP
jgi:hypothetical protein